MFDSDDDLLNHRRQLMGCNVGSPRPWKVNQGAKRTFDGSEPSDPLSLRQAHHVESFQSDLTEEPVADDFGDILYWDNLPANNLQVNLDEQMPLQLDFPLPLQVDGSFNDGFN